MATLGSKLITKEQQYHANMTDLNHLGRLLNARPHLIEGTMNQLFTSKNYYSDNPLSSLLMGTKAGEMTISQHEWEWSLKGASTRPLVIVENVIPSSITEPGKFIRPFQIKVDKNWWKIGDVICPGTANKKFQCRIQDEPVKHGDGFLLTVVLVTDVTGMFMPTKYLQPNTKWVKLYSTYEEGATQGGSVQFSDDIALRDYLGKFRKSYKITDYAASEVLSVGVADPNGKMHKTWMPLAEVVFWKQWYRELERAWWYNRSSNTITGSTGRVARTFAGIQEKLEASHIHRYSKLTTRLIEEYLMDIFYGRVKPGAGRAVKGFTGEYGMFQFHKAVQDWQNKSGFITNVEVYTNKVGSPMHKNALEAGYQFVKYNMANGSSLELIHNPLYDDRDINFELDEITGYPKESQRITFLDFGSESNSNIKIVNKTNGYSFGYVNGIYGNNGPLSGGNASHAGEFYEMHVSKVCGLHIGDPTACGELILDRM
jgi:hypothetical protein